MMTGRFVHTTRTQLQMTFRNRVALFWSLAFPIIFMSLLGLLFGRSIDAGTITVVDKAHVAQSRAIVQALDRTKGITVKLGSDVATARNDVHDGDRDGALVLTAPANGTVNLGPGPTVRAHLYTSNTDGTQAAIIAGIVSGVTNRVGNPQPAVELRSSTVDSSSLRYVDFLLPGIIGIAIMTSSVFGLSTILVDWRKRGILRRLKLTPMPLWQFFGARVAASLVLTLLQVVVLLAFGRIAFGVHISADAWAAVPVALVGCLAFLAFGFFVGSIVGSPETADAVANSVTTPMMFLSGTFFPISALPAVLATVAKALPLYYLSAGLRDSAVRGLGFTHVLPAIGVLCAMTAILAAVSLRTFRWEPKT
jgi:ABC-2 type transport system permease protein